MLANWLNVFFMVILFYCIRDVMQLFFFHSSPKEDLYAFTIYLGDGFLYKV